MCSQFNVSVNFMKSFFSFAKNNENMMCIFGDCRWHANILLWNIGRVSLEIAPIIESLKILHYAMVRVWEYLNIFVKGWPYCQETQQIDFGTLIDFEIICTGDILLKKYWETCTKIRSVVMFSKIGDWSIQVSPYVNHKLGTLKWFMFLS